MNKYLQVYISAENNNQADMILNSLLNKKLVTGGQFLQSPARFLWKGKINNMDEYVTITSFTKESHKQKIIDDVKKTSIEEVPMIQFLEFDGNEELLNWIDKTVG
jgi:uncharacterized protein involved in tolerance to divalent cations